MTREEIYARLVSGAESGTVQIDIPSDLIASTANTLRSSGHMPRRGWFAFGRRGVSQDIKDIRHALLSNISVHEMLCGSLMLMGQTHGYWHFWDIDGNLISRTGQPKRLAYRLIGDREFWFRELCGYKHLPVFPPQWLKHPISASELPHLPRSYQEQLDCGAEPWVFEVPQNERGPLFYRAGYAFVRDGVPVAELTTIMS